MRCADRRSHDSGKIMLREMRTRISAVCYARGTSVDATTSTLMSHLRAYTQLVRGRNEGQWTYMVGSVAAVARIRKELA
jgi:hypothetical protein